MRIHQIRLNGFRVYDEASFSFGPELNMIWGPNARGKTSILEAIYLLSLGRSFRTSVSKEMIQFGKQALYIEASFHRNGIDHTLSFATNGKERKILYNGNPCSSMASLLELLQCVVVAPDDNLISGPPLARRFFMDLHISQMDPVYLNQLSRYQKALKQRNALLKEEKTAGIEPWEHELAKSGAYIHTKRCETLEELSTFLDTIYPQLSHENEHIHLHYVSKCPKELSHDEKIAFYQKALEENRQRDLILGSTSAGSHRDEMRVSLGSDDSRKFASEGQKRTCVVALRLAVWEKLKEHSGEPPIMLIDDIGANLDANRRQRLMDYTDKLGQVFITSTLDPGEQPTRVSSISLASSS